MAVDRRSLVAGTVLSPPIVALPQADTHFGGDIVLLNALGVIWLFVVIAFLFLRGGLRLHARSADGIDEALYARDCAERAVHGDT